MNKHEIYKNFRSKFIGYIVLQQHYNNEKALTKKRELTRNSSLFATYFAKRSLLNSV